MHNFEKHDIKVFDAFIEKFAQQYVNQRSQNNIDFDAVDSSFLFDASGFDSSQLKKRIIQSSVAKDIKREKGANPTTLNDIYRSDLGELLMTCFFEEKINEEERFTIPLKNISDRELAAQPGRGLDAVGYRLEGNVVNILLGEAKVSAEKKSPPQVVDSAEDSIYKSQKKNKEDIKRLVDRLSDHCKKLQTKDAAILGLGILLLENEDSGGYKITYGCTLIRDSECVNEEKDFGKLKSNSSEFDPNKIRFAILSFTDKNIVETVNLFYQKVQEIIGEDI